VFTFHSNPTTEGKILSLLPSASLCFTFLSNYQRHQFQWLKDGTVIYPGIDVARYHSSSKKQEYLAYVGRISEQKGALNAISIARQASLPIKLAGKPRREDMPYFNNVLQVVHDYKYAEFVGEVNDTERNRLVAAAIGLLFPITSGEAFGLVQIEAMAVGTPVITYDIGAAHEIVVHGKTGYIVATMEDAVEAVRQLGSIDPAECRRHVRENFSAERMAREFVSLYSNVV